jgi:hypothetical protein
MHRFAVSTPEHPPVGLIPAATELTDSITVKS